MDGSDVLQEAAARYGCIVHPEASFYRAKRGESAIAPVVYDPVTRLLVTKPTDGLKITPMRRERIASMANRQRAARLAAVKEVDQVKEQAKLERAAKQAEYERLVLSLAEEGHCRAEIARRIGLSPSMISLYAQKLGVKLPAAVRFRTRPPAKAKEPRPVKEPKPKRNAPLERRKEVEALALPLLQQGLSAKEVSRRLSASKETIRKIRDENGIPIFDWRNPDKVALDFNERQAARLAEQIEQMRAMFLAGMTREKIQREMKIGCVNFGKIRDAAGIVFRAGGQPSDQITPDVLTRAKLMRSKGLTFAMIAQKLGIPRSTIHKALANAAD